MSPYRLETPFPLSLSGGRTSAFMLRKALDAFDGKLPDDGYVTFANTGKERPETLDFVHQIEKRWSVPIVWLEYRYIDGRHTIAEVNYETASRKGEPFSKLIEVRKFCPNPVSRFCTTELKIRVMKKFMLSKGLEEWNAALGLRADEPSRVQRAKVSCASERWQNVTPMAAAGHGLDDVMEFWRQSRGGLSLGDWLKLCPADRPGWDLALRPDEGNCDLCFLKGGQKIANLIERNPRSAEWWIAQEEKTGGTFRADRPNYRNIRLAVLTQGRLFDSHEYDVCNCTD